jgi:ATP-binding cassette subfamily F protein uup
VWREYAGGYSDWLVQRPPPPAAAPAKSETPARTPARRERAPRPGVTFNEKRELDALPAAIEALEAEQHALNERMCAPGYHQQPPAALKVDRERAEAIEHALARKFERWAELDAKAGAAPQ